MPILRATKAVRPFRRLVPDLVGGKVASMERKRHDEPLPNENRLFLEMLHRSTSIVHRWACTVYSRSLHCRMPLPVADIPPSRARTSPSAPGRCFAKTCCGKNWMQNPYLERQKEIPR